MTINNNVIRDLNTEFGIQQNLNGAIVNYSLQWVYNTSLNNSASSKVYLEYTLDTPTQNWNTIAVVEYDLTVPLSLTINQTNSLGLSISGVVPTSSLIRIRTVGVVPFYIIGQEVLM